MRRSAVQVSCSESGEQLYHASGQVVRQKTQPFSSQSDDKTVQEGSNRIGELYDETESVLTPGGTASDQAVAQKRPEL